MQRGANGICSGFPPPGHDYWNAQTLADVQAGCPGLDITAYERGD